MKQITRRYLPVLSLLTAPLTCLAITDEEDKVEGTANPDPAPIVADEKAILATINFPEGMVAEVFAREPDVQNPTAISIDEKNRLFISETHRFDRGIEDNRRNLHWIEDDIACRTTADRLAMFEKHAAVKPMSYYTEHSEIIRLVEDRDGDGKADHSNVYADGFNDPLDGTAAGIMAANGKVYFACIPHVWMLEDTNDDGVADERVSLQDGFGVNVSLSGHDLNGFAFGPDGRVYFTIGDRGYQFETKEGNQYSAPNSGSIFRMEPDGSNLEVVHTGLRNPKEIAFDRYGNAFSVDNNADMGDKARLVYIVEGGHSGWHRGNQHLKNFRDFIDVSERHQPNWVSEAHWEFEGANRPAAMLPPVAYLSNGPSGLAYNPGIGLSEQWDNHFFVCDYKGASSAVIAFAVEPDGAGFKTSNVEPFITGFLNTDVEFGYDGKMYVSDYVGSWSTYGYGNIFTFYDPEEVTKPVVNETRNLFNTGFENLSPASLGELLSHQDMRVRLRSQFALASDESNLGIFVSATGPDKTLVTRLHGVWGLGQLARKLGSTEAATVLIELTRDSNGSIRGQAAKALGAARAETAKEALTELLSDDDASTRMLSAIALGKLGDADSIPSLLALAASNDDSDPYVRHGAVEALVRIGDANALLEQVSHSSSAVRRAAVLALRRLEDPRIAEFLNDPDQSIAVETIQAINDRYLEEAYTELAKHLRLLGKVSPEIDYRILNASFRNGTAKDALRLLKLAANEKRPSHIRAESLFLLRRWENPPPVDPTTGKHAPLEQGRSLDEVQDTLSNTLLTILSRTQGSLLTEALRTSQAFSVDVPTNTLLAHLKSNKNTEEVRLTALDALVANADADESVQKAFVAALKQLIRSPSEPVRGASLAALANYQPDLAYERITELIDSQLIRDAQVSYEVLGKLDHPEAAAKLLERLKSLDDQPAEVRLDIVEACAVRDEPEIKEALAAYEASFDPSDPVAPYRITLAGGDVERGRKIVFEHGAAQCTRCHKVEKRQVGGVAGPNLEGIGKRQSDEYILEALVDPSAKLAPGYSPVSITMKDGTVVAGMLMEETDDYISVHDPSCNETINCDRSEIESMPTPMSTMPPMNFMLKKKELRDVVAYLSNQFAKGKKNPSGHPDK